MSDEKSIDKIEEQFAKQSAVPAIDDESKKAAYYRAVLEEQKRKREQACATEIDKAIASILLKHKCQAKFMELREGGQTTRIWIQPVALDDPPPQG